VLAKVTWVEVGASTVTVKESEICIATAVGFNVGGSALSWVWDIPKVGAADTTVIEVDAVAPTALAVTLPVTGADPVTETTN
jgi:hypothetical protein